MRSSRRWRPRSRPAAIRTLGVRERRTRSSSAGADFNADFAKVAATITLSVGQSETAAASTWSLNGSHTSSRPGRHPRLRRHHQPRAADDRPALPARWRKRPCSATSSSSPLVAGGDMNAKVDGYEIRPRQLEGGQSSPATSRPRGGRTSLHDGLVAGTGPRPRNGGHRLGGPGPARRGRALTLAPIPTLESLDVSFVVGHVHDGRYWQHLRGRMNCPRSRRGPCGTTPC
jgi:hypothetical protein